MSGDGRQVGDLVTQLLMESRRSTATDTLLKYNDLLVRSIIREQRALEGLITTALAEVDENGPMQMPPSVIIHQSIIFRNKRGLLAYHQHRIDFLKSLYWSLGATITPILSSPTLRANLSPNEVDFLRAYNASIIEFRSHFSNELDISLGVKNPPKDLNVVVEVLKDCGIIQTEQGAVDLRKGQRFMVRRQDVEHLIVQGYLNEVQH